MRMYYHHRHHIAEASSSTLTETSYLCRSVANAIEAVIEPVKETVSASEESANMGGIEVLGAYFRDREVFQGKIRRHLVQKELIAVSTAQLESAQTHHL